MLEGNLDNKKEYEVCESPGAQSWLLAIVSTAVILIALSFFYNLASSVHNVVIKKRINKILDNSNNPELVLDDSYVKILPKASLNRIEKAVGMYATIKEDNYLSAKMLTEDPYFILSKEIFELRKEVVTLLNSKAKDSVVKKVKESALLKVVSIIRDECLPETTPLGEKTFNKINRLSL